MSKKELEKRLQITFPEKIEGDWRNGVKDWHIKDATAGLYTLDIEHISDELVVKHNNPNDEDNIATRYRQDLCVHKCPTCFNEESMVYSQHERDLDGNLIKDANGNLKVNTMMSLEQTIGVVDQARDIAKTEGHDFRSVKFLGPGELLINPQLFEIIEAYQERGIQFNIFTKGAILGDDGLAMKYHGMTSKELVEKLASYSNVGLLFSFQSFDNKLQDALVSSKEEDGKIKGLQNYAQIRDQSLENIFNSSFYEDGMTDRMCMINAPIVPENIDESFDIYRFFVERGTPVVMTPSMLSGKGCGQVQRQNETIGEAQWHEKLVELYAQIYAYNVEKGIQTHEQILSEGIASYVGAEPCNQAATGLYIRANGLVQSCPGRFDKETVYANVLETPLKDIWNASSNRIRGIEDPHNLVNNKCPAKDGGAFPLDFYDRVMARYEQLRK